MICPSSGLAALLKATEQMRNLHPTSRESAAWERERVGLTVATVLGATASLLAYPTRAPIVIPEYQPPVIHDHAKQERERAA